MVCRFGVERCDAAKLKGEQLGNGGAVLKR
jgi:hypothetical protein